MKKISKKAIILLALLLVLILSIGIFSIFPKIKNIENFEIIEEVDGEFTGYQLILTASYGGAGVHGQDLGHGTKIKTYNIPNHCVFYEPAFGGGIWTMSKCDSEADVISFFESPSPFGGKPIFAIENLNEDKIISSRGTLNYNTESDSFMCRNPIMDGTNYHYTVKIIKVDKP